MVVDDLYAIDSSVGPDKADPVFVIDANRVLSSTIALEGLQSVARRNFEIFQSLRYIKLLEFTKRYFLNV